MTGILKTPLIAAFFYVLVLSGCDVNQADTVGAINLCPTSTTPVAHVQGNTTESPMLGQRVTVKGIVTLVQTGHGLYIEEPGSDMDEHTSNAIFIETAKWPASVEQGSLISAEGQVSEIGSGRYSMTAIAGIDELVHCESNLALPLSDASLPLSGRGREALKLWVS